MGYWLASGASMGTMMLVFAALTQHVVPGDPMGSKLPVILSYMLSAVLGASLYCLLCHIIQRRGTKAFRTNLASRFAIGITWALGHFAFCGAIYLLLAGTSLALSDRYLSSTTLLGLFSLLFFNVAVQIGDRAQRRIGVGP